jgi:hypothetical protein
MSELKRLCPACGAANPLENQTCRACGANIRSTLPMPYSERLPVPWKQVGTSLAVGAGALALRVGVNLVRQVLERKAASVLENRAATRLPVRAAKEAAPAKGAAPAPQRGVHMRAWGRRVRSRWQGGRADDVEVEEFFWQGFRREE